MELYTFYSHHIGFERILEIMCEFFPETSEKILPETIAQNNFEFVAEGIHIQYRQRQKPSYELKRAECPVTQNLMGMFNFVQQIPAKSVTIQDLLLSKILTLNSEFSIKTSTTFSERGQAFLGALAKEWQVIVFAQPHQTFSKAVSQHFLNQDFDLILDTEGNTHITNLPIVIDSKYFDGEAKPTQEQMMRKENSESFLREKGIAINAHLPCLPTFEQVKLRTKEEIIERIYALTLLTAWGEGVEKEKLEHVRNQWQVAHFSPQESAIYAKEILDDTEKIYATWRYEGLNLLLWAVSLVELAYPDDICDVGYIVSIILGNSREEFFEKAELRHKEAILQEADKAYRMHWACVDARLKNQQVGGELHEGVIYERRYALEWLISEQEWDNIEMHT